MSISGKQTINIGLPNESVGSDSLYTAFTKSQTNFDTLFACASPYSTFTAGTGINVNANSSTGIVSITNSGVTNIIAGTNIVISGANGNVTISSTGGGNGNGGGTVTSVGVTPVSTDRLTTTGSPVISSGNINIDLAVIANITPATYTNPNVTVDVYGRVTAVSNGASAGSVTSVGLTPGTGIQINGGPITSNGNITVTNIGVTRVTAGTGILVSSSNGNVTISSTSSGGTVTAVGVSSTQLVVSGSPIVNSGTIVIDLPASATFSGSLSVTGNANVGNLNTVQVLATANVTAPRLISNIATGTAPFVVNSTTQVANLNVATAGTVITNAQPNITSVGTLTALAVTGNVNVGNIDTAQVLATANVTTPQVIANIATGTAPFVVNSTTQVANLNAATAGTVTTNAQPNITSVGTLTSLVVTGNANVGNLGFGSGVITGTGNVSGGNITTTGSLTANTMFLPSSENLVSGSAANHAVTASYFTTTGASTATLAAGTVGLIKTFMMVDNTGGAMVITVTNAGWKSSGTGTITFNGFGVGCTLQYINNKWYAIGINSVTFA